MLRKHKIITKIIDSGIVAIVRVDEPGTVCDVVQACIDGGLCAVELTFTVNGAHRIIEKLSTTMPKCILGAGTVLDSETARIAILSGASYIVSPNFDRETALLCNRYAIPYMAGCFTPKEAIEAMEYGVDIIKLFPAGLLGIKSISAFQGPLPQGNFMPTGGVNLENAKDWINAGAVSLGIGGDLVVGARTGDFNLIRKKASAYKAAVESARKQKNEP